MQSEVAQQHGPLGFNHHFCFPIGQANWLRWRRLKQDAMSHLQCEYVNLSIGHVVLEYIGVQYDIAILF